MKKNGSIIMVKVGMPLTKNILILKIKGDISNVVDYIEKNFTYLDDTVLPYVSSPVRISFFRNINNYRLFIPKNI